MSDIDGQWASIELIINDKMSKIDFTPVLEEIVHDLERDSADVFASERGPEGEPWPRLAPATIKRKGHALKLKETMALANSLGGRNGYSIRKVRGRGAFKSIEFGTTRPWAMVHQEGGKRVPQRKFLGYSAERLAEIKRKLLAFAKSAMAEGSS